VEAGVNANDLLIDQCKMVPLVNRNYCGSINFQLQGAGCRYVIQLDHQHHIACIENYQQKGKVMGLLDAVKKEVAKFDGDSAHYLPNIKVTTCAPQGKFELVTVIFALDSHQEGIFSGAKPEAAFVGATNKLKDQCQKLGGTAVINTQFEYRVAVGKGMMGGAKQVIEIFAYGTVIKEDGV
jgi:hypothetical protein